ncbi:sigma-70 family RNA polymerase sigma factor [Streptomyces sp. NPDC001530]|uniref:sigma-70 family RNA polymerase sigma factor n=1 Tax=Streptomyces sp. NPDC001530 TaxID=3364582 RepID=UPI003690238C
MPASDAELTRAVRASGLHSNSADQALEELYRRHRPSVLAYARTCCRDTHTAEDLASEAFARTLQAVRAGQGPEFAWRPYLLSVVRRTAADWASTARRTDLSPDFERWLETAPTEKGGEEYVLRQEDDALIVRGFRSLPERWRAVLWHTVVEGESAEQVGALLGISPSGVGSLAARAREGLREAYLTAHIEYVETADQPECRHFSRLLAAAIRRPGRRLNKDLARHLDGCGRCSHAMLELTDLNERMRLVLPGALLLWAAPAYLASRLAGAGTAASGAGSAGAHLPKVKVNPLGASVAAGITAVAAVGGFLLLRDNGNDLRTAPPAPTPTLTTAPEPSRSTPSPSSPTPGVTRPVHTPTPVPTPSRTPTPTLPKADGATRLRIKSTGLCMETTGAFGAQPREAACNGSASQTWELVRNEVGRLQLRNPASKMCLTYPEQLPDGAVVRQLDCGKDTRGQWWDYSASQDNGDMVLNPIGDNSRRLGLNEWNLADGAHSPTIGITLNYYSTTSLIFLFDGEL